MENFSLFISHNFFPHWFFQIKKASLRNISRQCGIKNDYFQYGFELTAIVFFLMPITLITILYVLIGINLRRSSQQIKNDPTKLTNKITKKELTTHLNSTAGSHEPDYINLYQRNNSVSSSNQKQIASRRSVIRMLGKKIEKKRMFNSFIHPLIH